MANVTAIQKLKLQAVWSDLGFLSDDKLTADEKIAKIDEFDARVAKFIPDDEQRAAAMNELLAMGEKLVENGATAEAAK